MPPGLRTLGRWIARLGGALMVLFCLWAVAYVIGSYRFRTYTLPNGMIVKREYADWLLRHEYYDIYAPDGVTLRAPDVCMICFNDRFLEAWGWRQEDGGIFDGYDNGRPLSGSEYTAASRELSQPRRSCDGYFIGWLGPELLYPHNRSPFLAPCEWRNRNNPSLRNREWLNWPCEDNSHRLPDGPT
jgi:hypothetical protein